MSLYPFGTVNLTAQALTAQALTAQALTTQALTTQVLTTQADRHRQPAITKGQAARILLIFLACALAFTVISRQNRAGPAADASGLVRLAPI